MVPWIRMTTFGHADVASMVPNSTKWRVDRWRLPEELNASSWEGALADGGQVGGSCRLFRRSSCQPCWAAVSLSRVGLWLSRNRRFRVERWRAYSHVRSELASSWSCPCSTILRRILTLLWSESGMAKLPVCGVRFVVHHLPCLDQEISDGYTAIVARDRAMIVVTVSERDREGS